MYSEALAGKHGQFFTVTEAAPAYHRRQQSSLATEIMADVNSERERERGRENRERGTEREGHRDKQPDTERKA